MKMARTKKYGFTLVELICVMMVLSAVLAMSAPSLSRYFSGRSLENESGRFLALTRYVRSEAVSRSEMMELWVDVKKGTYGVSTREFLEDGQDSQSKEYSLAEKLSFDIEPDLVDDQGMAKILVWPDGSIDSQSFNEIEIHRTADDYIVIAQADFGLGYIIKEDEMND